MDHYSRAARKNTSHEIKSCRKILRTSHTKTTLPNEEVCAKIQEAIGPHEDLLTIVKRHKLQRYGHVSRSSGLAKIILPARHSERGRRQGRQRKRWEDNIKVRQVPEGSGEQGKMEEKLVAKSFVVPQRPSWLRDR